MQLVNTDSILFVDFFDTVMFREVSPTEAKKRWAQLLQKRYPILLALDSLELVQLRTESFELARQTRREPCFDDAMLIMLDILGLCLSAEERDSFIEVAGTLDRAVELGCQYPNFRLLKYLKNRRKSGAQIYIVSDYYWGQCVLNDYLQAANISQDLFDDIFVSCDYKASKSYGDLYEAALKVLNISADRVTMLGDNPKSDGESAKAVGLHSIIKRNEAHKAINKIKEILGVDNSKGHIKRMARRCYHYGLPYSEYVTAFWLFIERLHRELIKDEANLVSFVAREGQFLMRLYKDYQLTFIPESDHIPCAYLRCSRRSVYAGIREDELDSLTRNDISVRNWLKSVGIELEEARKYIELSDDEVDEVAPLLESPVYKRMMSDVGFSRLYLSIVALNRDAFLCYITQFLDGNRLRLVDSGWKGTIQLALLRYYGIESDGYYIGTQHINDEPEGIRRKGLLFGEPDKGIYDYAGMNFPFYQQLLSASHGSAMKCIFKDDRTVDIVEEWDPVEQNLFKERISSMQDQMALLFMGLCAWDDAEDQLSEWTVAREIFHSNMFSYGARFDFAQDCEKSFFVNFRQEKSGGKVYEYRNAPIGLDIIIHPKKYIRYVTKIQRSPLYERRIIRFLYPIAARIYYSYTLLIEYINSDATQQTGFEGS